MFRACLMGRLRGRSIQSDGVGLPGISKRFHLRSGRHCVVRMAVDEYFAARESFATVARRGLAETRMAKLMFEDTWIDSTDSSCCRLHASGHFLAAASHSLR